MQHIYIPILIKEADLTYLQPHVDIILLENKKTIVPRFLPR